jgi:hypothetical protein
MPKKNIWANLQRIIQLFTQKIATMLSRIKKSSKNFTIYHSGISVVDPDPEPYPDWIRIQEGQNDPQKYRRKGNKFIFALDVLF